MRSTASATPRAVKAYATPGLCDFLIAAPVKSFDSGDTNRDLHMIQVTRGAQYPLITGAPPPAAIRAQPPTLDCDLEVQFAGNTAHYTQVAFQQTISGATHHITGVVPATLTDFKIEPPSFLTIPIKNAIPVRVDMLGIPLSGLFSGRHSYRTMVCLGFPIRMLNPTIGP